MSSSEEDYYHCCLCDEKEWDEKGLKCPSCEEFFCSHCWQTTFKTIGCRYEDDSLVCEFCWDETKESKKYCPDKKCKCDNHSPVKS